MYALLTVIFIILKLTNKIDWNWGWVFAPLIFQVGVLILAVMFSGF